VKISLLTGGDDPSYALPLTSSLTALGIDVDLIGNDAMRDDKTTKHERVNYLNFRGDQNPNAPFLKKTSRIVKYYCMLMKYTATTDSRLFHILWLNKFVYLDRTLLNLYYKLMGKRIVFTAHNINDKERDGGDSIFNRLTLRFLYSVVDHIFVHTNKMRQKLVADYAIDEKKITVIPFGINNHVPNSTLTCAAARRILGIEDGRKIMLFFGRIAKYKGLDRLIEAHRELVQRNQDVTLLIAGNIKAGHDSYWRGIQAAINNYGLQNHIIRHIEYIPDEKIEIYCKAADVLILPYRNIFQTGVLFLSYNFGLPAIATDVGSLREEIIEGKTGYICKPDDVKDMANCIAQYFSSDLYDNLSENRLKIIEYAHDKYSWAKISEVTRAVYSRVSI